MHPEEKIAQLGITLPAAATPAAVYVPFVQSGNLLFLSGHIPKRAGQVVTGQLGRNMQTADAKQVAREVTIDLLGTLKAAVGDLGRIQRIVKVMGLVNSAGKISNPDVASLSSNPPLAQTSKWRWLRLCGNSRLVTFSTASARAYTSGSAV